MKTKLKDFIFLLTIPLIIYFILDDYTKKQDYSRMLISTKSPSQQNRKFVMLVNKTNNVCYFNCIIQSLLPFKDYFDKYEGKMALILRNLFITIEKTDEFSVNLLPEYKKALDVLKMSRFNIFKPGDAMELIHFILNHIIGHEIKKQNIEIQEDFYFHQSEYQKIKYIKVIQDFCTIVEFEHSEYYWFVPVISHSFNSPTIQIILNDFFRINKKPTTKRFINLPKVFIVNFWKKLGNLSEINLADQLYIKIDETEYRLNSVILFIKRENGGHYYSASLVKNQWYLFDEDKITQININNYKTGFIAVAIYEKLGYSLK
ncbi:hypothetical protein TUBRATIS_24530 [Tubulinosema ratisbonensis]|uniref:USP domain-containing protein n=1 Tax=Tubulinosema ratisbonensis TaxID=291195 RepID=A0A437AIV0_9MICR|nr:hypothetical protein TUBRATIS_24530 [Tubulinosema ratisbonensis]